MNGWLPCPFCGSMDVVQTTNADAWPIVMCCDCGATGPCIYLAEGTALEKWNERYFGETCQVKDSHQRVFEPPAKYGPIDNEPASIKPKKRKRG